MPVTPAPPRPARRELPGATAMRQRMIVHQDADAFFASVEQAADPRLRGKPVAVGGEQRGVIASASYEARACGVRAAMPTALARRLCPRLIVLPGDFEKYERFSRWMFSYAYDFTPEVEICSIDEGYFDLTGARGAPVEIAATIRRAIRQALKISVSEGIGSSKLVSQIASKLRKPAAFECVPPGRERAFLHPLPHHWLPGVGPKSAERLRAAGLARIGQVAVTPPQFLALLVGGAALQLRAFANGQDDRPVVREVAPAKSYSRQETFGEDTTDEQFARATLRGMADDLMAQARADGKSIRTVTVRVRYNDRAEDQRSESLPEPTDLETDLYPRLDALLRQAWKRRVSLRMLSLKLSNVYAGSFRAELPLEPDARQYAARRRLAAAIDALRESRGRCVIMRGHDLARRASSPNRRRPRAPLAPPRCPANRAADFGLAGCVPLRVRSYYSFLDSTLSPAALVELARRHGLPAVALTDATNLHGAVAFAQAARAAGIKPIFGAELSWRGRPTLMFVENPTGYRNLCRILSRVAAGQRADDDETDGLILEPAGSHAPVHYATPSGRLPFDILQSIRTLTLLRQQHPRKCPPGAFHFPAPPEQAARATASQLRRAREIVERCQFEFATGGLQFPAFAPPDGSTPRDFLRRLAQDGLRRCYRSGRRFARARIERELAIIQEVGYEEYFLTVWHILRQCRQRGIEWITRGSAADSLVCYCLGISNVCPIRFGLDFRRFLNRDRMQLNKLPDIDIDFPHDRKDEVVELVFREHGARHTALVGGFSTYLARSAFADVAKALGASEFQIRRFTERLPHARARDLERAIRDNPACRDLPWEEEPYATARRMARWLDGFPRYPKMHPCGVVLSRAPITDLLPCFISRKGYPATQFDMDACEAIGLVKFDILAQGGLAVMRDARQALARRGVTVDFNALKPWRDPAVWEMIAGGEARAVHHIESPAMISLCRMCNVREIDGLIAIVSVIRPGAANEQKKQHFARRYQGLEPVRYPHPSLRDCLRDSYGQLVYEEQLLQICEAFAGLPPGQADLLRRALNKEDRRRLATLARAFVRCARQRGRAPAEIATVWTLLRGFSGYAFCKAHSTAYGVEACQAAWLKRYHPAEFMAAVLTNGKGFYRPLVYALECHRLGIPLLPPWINEPGPAFAVLTGLDARQRIRAPVTRIKGLSQRTAERLLAQRARGEFESLADFYRRTLPTAEEMEWMMRVGAFDGFGRPRTAQFWEIQRLSARGVEPHPWLWPDGGGSEPVAPGVALTEPTRLQRLQWETELLDFPVSGHPLEMYPDIAWDTYCPVTALGEHRGQTVVCCGLLIEDRVHQQVNGEPMKFLTLADPTGIVETELFAKGYKRYGPATVRYPVLEVTATVEPFENGRGYTLRVHRAGAPRKISKPLIDNALRHG
jgi:DNA-directed DNA polymerase III PolC